MIHQLCVKLSDIYWKKQMKQVSCTKGDVWKVIF